MENVIENLPILLVFAFFAVLFLQSGLDKVFNYAGNRQYLQTHFADSPLSGWVGMLMPAITLLEVLAGVLSGAGVLQLLFFDGKIVGWWGLVCSELSLLALFFGQRMAKDYAGSAALVPYFLVGLVGFGLLR